MNKLFKRKTNQKSGPKNFTIPQKVNKRDIPEGFTWPLKLTKGTKGLIL